MSTGYSFQKGHRRHPLVYGESRGLAQALLNRTSFVRKSNSSLPSGVTRTFVQIIKLRFFPFCFEVNNFADVRSVACHRRMSKFLHARKPHFSVVVGDDNDNNNYALASGDRSIPNEYSQRYYQ